MENSVDSQRAVNSDLQSSVESLTNKLSEVEQAYNEEMSNHKTTHSRLERLAIFCAECLLYRIKDIHHYYYNNYVHACIVCSVDPICSFHLCEVL